MMQALTSEPPTTSTFAAELYRWLPRACNFQLPASRCIRPA
jgi:hypothetical protein